MLRKWLDLAEKLFIVLVAVALVAYILMLLNFWAADWRTLFFSEGNLEMIIYISLFLFVLTYLFKRLLIWEVHLSLGKGKRRRK